MIRSFAIAAVLVAVAACGRLDQVGKAPAFTPAEAGDEYAAMQAGGDASVVPVSYASGGASLWSGSPASLLGDRRAGQRGDILTVVIEINDRAEITNSTDRSREGSERMGIPSFLGIPQRIDAALPEGASLGDAFAADSASSFQGSGRVSRNEKLTLRVAATVIETLPNGILRIEGKQEVRVNYEVRELIVTGFVRPEDVSRQNEITYDKIAGARISYGGRGQISDAQQPRYGQQAADAVLPF